MCLEKIKEFKKYYTIYTKNNISKIVSENNYF